MRDTTVVSVIYEFPDEHGAAVLKEIRASLLLFNIPLHIFLCAYIYIYIFTYLFIYINMYVFGDVCIPLYIYMYIHTEIMYTSAHDGVHFNGRTQEGAPALKAFTTGTGQDNQHRKVEAEQDRQETQLRRPAAVE